MDGTPEHFDEFSTDYDVAGLGRMSVEDGKFQYDVSYLKDGKELGSDDAQDDGVQDGAFHPLAPAGKTPSTRVSKAGVEAEFVFDEQWPGDEDCRAVGSLRP